MPHHTLTHVTDILLPFTNVRMVESLQTLDKVPDLVEIGPLVSRRVLELNGGVAASIGLKVGDKVRHPFFKS